MDRFLNFFRLVVMVMIGTWTIASASVFLLARFVTQNVFIVGVCCAFVVLVTAGPSIWLYLKTGAELRGAKS